MIYLDNAATTYPKPQQVAVSVNNAVRIYGGNPGRSGHALSLKTSQKIFEVRQKLADFFGAEMENVIFTSNCTHALNMAIKGVLSGGGHAIISQLEHNSVIRPVHALSLTGKVEYDVARVYEGDEEQTLHSFKGLICSSTKVIVCTHASNVTGMVMPIQKLGKLCREKGILLIVDAAQTAGVLPINMKEMNIDILCTAGHKGLFGTTGTGLMILNTATRLDTLMEGGTGSVSAQLEQPEFMPDRFESGTINTVGILSMGAGLSHIQSVGIDRIYQHEFFLCNLLYSQLKTIKHIKIYCKSYEKYRYAPIVLFNFEGINSLEVVEKLSKKGFAVRGGLHCAPMAHTMLGTEETGAVRVSPQYYNTRRDIMMLAAELKQIANNL